MPSRGYFLGITNFVLEPKFLKSTRESASHVTLSLNHHCEVCHIYEQEDMERIRNHHLFHDLLSLQLSLSAFNSCFYVTEYVSSLR